MTKPLEALMPLSRVSEIANGATPLMGEKERLAKTTMWYANELKIATDAFQAAGLAQIAAEEALEQSHTEREEFRHRLKLERAIVSDNDYKLAKLRYRIAELEASQLAVKLPPKFNVSMGGDKLTRIAFRERNTTIDECAIAIRAAGGTVYWDE